MRITPHMLRHSMITDLLDAGATRSRLARSCINVTAGSLSWPTTATPARTSDGRPRQSSAELGSRTLRPPASFRS